MFNIVLFEPEIPPNTGNIIRLCSNADAILHLIQPLGFDLNEKTLRRASLDYIDNDLIQIYNNFKHFLKINETFAGHTLTMSSQVHSAGRNALAHNGVCPKCASRVRPKTGSNVA